MTELQELPQGDVSRLRLLILQSGTLGGYYSESEDWSHLLHKCHPASTMLPYLPIYQREGPHALRNRILRTIEEDKITAVFIDGPFRAEFGVPFLETLRSRVFVVALFTDVAQRFYEWFRYQAQAVDLALSSEYLERHLFGLYGVQSLHFPIFPHPEEYYGLESDWGDKDIPLAFVGRMDRVGRKEYLNHLKAQSLEVTLFGEGTAAGAIPKERKIDIYRRSQIGLNFTGCMETLDSDLSRPIDGRLRQLKGRLWELAFAKNLILTNYAPGIEEIFRIGKDLDVFENPAELSQKVRFYLRQEDRRKELAQNACDWARRRWSPYEKCRELLGVMAAKASAKVYTPARLYLDDGFLKRIALERATYAGGFSGQGRWALAWEELAAIFRSGQYDWLKLVKPFLIQWLHQMCLRHPTAFASLRSLRRRLVGRRTPAR